jgi:HK97 family phage prohead protease
MEMETKRCDRIDLKADATGEFHALISTFDRVDKYGDVVRRGAFTETIARWRARGDKLPVIFSHRADDPEMHVGEIDPREVREGVTGLEARGRFYLDEPVGRKVHAQIQRKALSEWSFAYRVIRAKPRPKGGRELLCVDLLEIGPCLAGVGETATLDVKAATRERRGGAGPLAGHYAQLDRALKRLAIAIASVR